MSQRNTLTAAQMRLLTAVAAGEVLVDALGEPRHLRPGGPSRSVATFLRRLPEGLVRLGGQPGVAIRWYEPTPEGWALLPDATPELQRRCAEFWRRCADCAGRVRLEPPSMTAVHVSDRIWDHFPHTVSAERYEQLAGGGR